MTVTPCPDCGAYIDSSLSACPGCGAATNSTGAAHTRMEEEMECFTTGDLACLRAQLADAQQDREAIAAACERFERTRKATQLGLLAGEVAVDASHADLAGALVDAQYEALTALLNAARRKR